jgi:cysteine desulfurase/selenocysteine lyase
METLTRFKDAFRFRQGIHFNSAGQSPVSLVVRDRVEQVIRWQFEQASFRDPDLKDGVQQARVTLARFLGAQPGELAFTPNVATALSQAALGYPLTQGDAVVTIDQEYSSSFIPWREACLRSGAELRVCRSDSDGNVDLDSLYEQIRGPVKIVAVSWVQFQTGSILDLKTLGELCRRQGAYLVVDGIQGLGQLPFSLKDFPVDFVAGAAHKWMCSTLGQGFFAGNPEFLRKLRPLSVGAGTYNDWGGTATRDGEMEGTARRFEAGGYSFTALFALESAASLLMDTGMPTIAGEIGRLSKILREGIVEQGLRLSTPMHQPGGITSLRLEAGHERRFLSVCGQRQVALSKRGPFVRFSPHALCTDAEVAEVLSILKETRS